MSVFQANCPSCAAPIEFRGGSTIVLICPFCRSAVARTDRGLEDMGKVAEIMSSESPLRLGLTGTFDGKRFELTGRAQNRHEMGGVWDEWYATFSSGRVGWLAEAQGRFYMTFAKPLPAGMRLPGFNSLNPGLALGLVADREPFIVNEKGTATSVAADGEIPYRLVPNEQSGYADLSGPNDSFATIDYSTSPPSVFVGKQVTLAEIGLGDAKPVEREARKVSTEALGCPNCGGALELTAPDKAERVACPYCSSLLDVNQGKLSWLKALKPSPSPHEFVLQIGAIGVFQNNTQYKIVGAVVRSVEIEGIKYFWHEYLLYNPHIGFRWLTHSDNHWNFTEPVNPADVVAASGTSVSYNGKTFKIFQDAPAVVEYVVGEFYWRVEQGETVRAVDFVAPPLMLSQESTGNEINWSLGTYLTTAEIEKAFSLSNLPKPWSVAPNQPFTGGFYIKYGLALLGLLCIIAIFMLPFSSTSEPLSETLTLQPTTSATTPQAAFSRKFELRGNRNVRITASAPVNNAFADLDVDLVNEQNQEVESVNVPIEYYAGVEGGESWTEGSQTQDATISSLPAGSYTLRVEGTWQNFQQPLPVTVKVEQNVSRGVNFCCAFVLLGLFPLVGLLRKFAFESRRWSESMFGGSSQS